MSSKSKNKIDKKGDIIKSAFGQCGWESVSDLKKGDGKVSRKRYRHKKRSKKWKICLKDCILEFWLFYF